MAWLAIKGHKTRSGEVIEVLKMFGNEDTYATSRSNDVTRIYYLGTLNKIVSTPYVNSSTLFDVFTLEEFLEKFPFRVGDFVHIPEYEQEVRICKMSWCKFGYVEYLVYRNDNEEWYSAEELNKYNEPYKEETEEKRQYEELRMPLDDDDKLATEATIDGNKITPPNNYLIGKVTQVDNGMLVEFIKKQPKYPKTYKDCCEVLMGETDFQDYSLVLTKLSINKNEGNSISPEPPHITLINNFYKLIICRDAYWKIAGEQMGLNKAWKPDWKNSDEFKYCLYISKNNVDRNINFNTNRIFAFPTEEIRDIFYVNFKELIEICKEFV